MTTGTRDPASLHTAVAALLREADQLYTSGRRELVELLSDLDGPVTIYELLEAKPRLTTSSVYRNLALLEEIGVVQRVAGTDDRARFELAEDLIGHHHHMICEKCGRIGDFVISSRAERSLNEILLRAVGSSGFTASGHRLDVVGTCAQCS